MNFIKNNWGLFIIILLSFFAIKPLLQSGFFPMHDDTQVARVFEMGKALHDGMFPVRWANDLGYGYGYPIFNFYAPLAFYVGGFFVLFGMDALLAAKTTMIIGILLSGICMYFLARKFWREMGGIISGLFYIYATYHAVDIYVRGDVAEFWAYGFLPLVFLGLYKVYLALKEGSNNNEIANSKYQISKIQKKYKKEILKGIIIGAVAYAGIILSHNLTAFIVTPFLICFIIALIFAISRRKKLYAIRYTLYAVLLGLLLSAFYWLPVPFEIKYTNVLSQIGGGADYKDHFVCPLQYWYSPWGYGGSAPGCVSGLSFMLGKLHFIFALMSLIGAFLIWKRKKNMAIAFVIIIGFVGLIGALFLGTADSSFIWNVIPFMTFLQYPWRFLVLASFFSSFLAGSVFFILTELNRRKVIAYSAGICSVAIIIFQQTKFFIPQKILDVNSNYYTNRQMLVWKTSKISDEYMPKDFVKPKSEKGVAKKTFSQEKTQEKMAIITSNSNTYHSLSIAYFPAWQFSIDNTVLPVAHQVGRIFIPIEQGKHIYKLTFQETGIERIADIVTIAGFVVLIIGIIYSITLDEKPYS